MTNKMVLACQIVQTIGSLMMTVEEENFSMCATMLLPTAEGGVPFTSYSKIKSHMYNGSMGWSHLINASLPVCFDLSNQDRGTERSNLLLQGFK